MAAVEDWVDYKYSYGFAPWQENFWIVRHSPVATTGFIYIAVDYQPEATFCAPQDKFICVRSELYAFAIPKSYTPDMQSWVFEGHTYEVVEAGLEIELFGRKFRDLIVVKTPAKATENGAYLKKDTLTLYSSKFGVLAKSKHWPPDYVVSPVWWLVGAQGFGALHPPQE